MVRQEASTGDMIFTVAETIAFCARFMTLEPGDIILTGTPSGVGATTQTYLQPGDRMEAWIEGLGTLVRPSSRRRRPMTRSVAMIGAGGIAQDHVAAYARIPGVRVSHIVDTDAARARSLAARRGQCRMVNRRGGGIRRAGGGRGRHLHAVRNARGADYRGGGARAKRSMSRSPPRSPSPISTRWSRRPSGTACR